MPPRKKLPLKDKEILERYNAGESTMELAAVCGCSNVSIGRRIRQSGGKLRSFSECRQKKLPLTDSEIMERYNTGENTIELANVCECCSETISKAIKRAGGGLRTKSEYQLKTTSEMEAEMRKRYDAGARAVDLAQEYNVDQSTVYYAIERAAGTIRSHGESQSKKLPLVDEEITNRYDAGETPKELGEACGCSECPILKAIKRAGGRLRTISEAKIKALPITDKELRKRYEDGENASELAEEYGCYPPKICRAIKRAGGILRDNGEAHYKKLPFTEVEVRKLYESGKTSRELAEICGCSSPMIGDVVRRAGGEMRDIIGENSHLWKGGVSFEPYCHKFNKRFKESIREKFGRVCFLCPTTEEENGRKLNVHHVNYNKDCLCDDSECEFVPLCDSCHSKTNHNQDYWESYIMAALWYRGLKNGL